MHQLGRPWVSSALVALLPGAAITVFSPGSADAFGCAAAVLGELVWASWRDFSRVLLPPAVLGAVALWPSTRADQVSEPNDRERGKKILATV